MPPWGKNSHRSESIPGLLVLDPAFPLLDTFGVSVNSSAADFVDVIHTSAGNDVHDVLRGKLGVARPLGHVDFYMNGGSEQPGCLFLGSWNSDVFRDFHRARRRLLELRVFELLHLTLSPPLCRSFLSPRARRELLHSGDQIE